MQGADIKSGHRIDINGYGVITVLSVSKKIHPRFKGVPNVKSLRVMTYGINGCTDHTFSINDTFTLVCDLPEKISK